MDATANVAGFIFANVTLQNAMYLVETATTTINATIDGHRALGTDNLPPTPSTVAQETTRLQLMRYWNFMVGIRISTNQLFGGSGNDVLECLDLLRMRIIKRG